MIRKIAAVCLLAVTSHANAGLMLLTATSDISPLEDFTVTFNDTGDGLLDFSEIIAFSGVNLGSFFGTRDILSRVASIAGISTLSGSCFTTNTTFWCFDDTDPSKSEVAANPDSWSYLISAATPTSVPEPGTFALVVAGIIAFGLMQRRKLIV